MNRPEPPPEPRGVGVSAALIYFIMNSDLSDDVKVDTIAIIEQRSEYGLEKYGQPLMTKDNRDDVIDSMQEMGDLLQYAFKAKMNGRLQELREAIRPSLDILKLILDD